MKHSKPIQIFEHQYLQIDEKQFLRRHWEKLGWYNETHGGGFFSLTPKGVKFNQYVGVIQVEDLTIEILPKIGKTAEENNKAVWQGVLIDMLRACNWMQVHAHEKAALQFKPNSILEAYLELFIRECEQIHRMGLIKKYRNEDSNVGALKGKLLFSQQIQKNLIHQERFYTRHQVYDRDNLYNQILYKALQIIPGITGSPFLKDRVYSLLLAFPELKEIKVTEASFEKLVFDRKTMPYREAIEIAAMLLLNYRPDVSSGRNHILAILFDMNDLWEEYIYRQLVRNCNHSWQIKIQNSRPFWCLKGSKQSKTIRPDLVIRDKKTEKSLVLDTKWKLPENNIPADADLKQMFVYNEYWQGKNAYLVYPHATYTPSPLYFEGNFNQRPVEQQIHGCGVVKLSVLDAENMRLDPTLGGRLQSFLKVEMDK